MSFLPITNGKTTSNFHVPVQIGAFKRPLFTGKSKGCNVIEIKTAQKESTLQEVPQTKVTTLFCPKWTLHYMSLLCHKQWLCCIQSGVSAGAEKLLRYKWHYLISDFAISDKFLVSHRRILAWTKNLLCYIYLALFCMQLCYIRLRLSL